MDITGLLPTNPVKGPPLPALLGIVWPWYKAPTPTTGLANLSGVVTDSATGLPVVGVLVSVNGTQVSTASNGQYALSGIKAGSYNVQFSKSGYQGKVNTMNIVAGNNTLNTQMTAIITTPTAGNLSGVVTDSATGQPINGVQVSIGGATTLTDAYGAYSFTNIPPGTYTVTFTKSGYNTVTK